MLIGAYSGRYRLWILAMQLVLIAILCQMALGSPSGHAVHLMMLALLLAVASATQDIAIDGYRADLLTAEERGLGIQWIAWPWS